MTGSGQERIKNHMTSDLLSVNESAEFLRIKSSTVREWILVRKVPFVKLGRRVFLKRGELEALINRSVVPASLTPRNPRKRA